jgi:phage terminase small subunit
MNEKSIVSQLSRKQSLFVEAQLAGANLTVAAKTAGIGYTTAQRWSKMEAIKEALKAGEDALFESALDELKQIMPRALEVYRKHMDAEVEPTAASQLAAATRLIEQAIDVHKLASVADELKELRRMLADANQR